MSKKKIIRLLLVMVMLLASVSMVYAGSHSWEAGWNQYIASASGEAYCGAREAWAEARCLALSENIVSTTLLIEATYQYKDSSAFNYYVEEDYSVDSTFAEVSFDCGSGYESMFLEYYYRASYTTSGATQDEVCSGSEIVYY